MRSSVAAAAGVMLGVAALMLGWRQLAPAYVGEGLAESVAPDAFGVPDEMPESAPSVWETIVEKVLPVNVDLNNANLRAFIALIREAEGTAGANGYRLLFGGSTFDSFADHPRVKVTARLGGKPITSTAAGAYQMLARTWDEARSALSLPDFAPASQDAAAAFLIRRRGALRDVMEGRLDVALAKCNREWASLPGSPYGQPTISAEKARRIFAEAGGNTTDRSVYA